MSDIPGVIRLHLVMVAVFAAGRWAQGLGGLPYERGHHVFSLVAMTFLSTAITAAFCRRWRGYGLGRALALGVAMGFVTQLVIFLSTVASYALGLQTYFNHPRALNVEAAIPLGQAITIRAGGIVFGSLAQVVTAGIGWLLGGLLPRPDEAASPAALTSEVPPTP